MADGRQFVIVGASLAGAKAAEMLREQGFDGRITLVGAEPERPYERPPLSKDYLRGEAGRASVYVHEEDWYDTHDVHLLLSTRAVALHPGDRQVELNDGARLEYDALLLSTGSEPRSLPVPGADLAGVLTLRTVQDSDAIAERLNRGGRVVVIGGGWIGCEVAASARQKGLEVTLVMPEDVPLERVLGREMGMVFGDVHADQGVELVTGASVEAIEGDGRAERVILAGGHPLQCDFVVYGVGVTPRVGLAEAAGLAVEGGVLVDERLEASVPGIFAAGDIASHQHPLLQTHVRVEHWANALNQGPAAARSMLGSGDPYELLPYFFSDQYDLGMEYTGWAPTWDDVVTRGDVAGREFIAFWRLDGRVVAGMNVNVWDVNEQIQEIVRAGGRPDPALLADPDVPLDDPRLLGR
jgi:3-phenylpropionate/trans-cinnamate dioxygenase ferredoxin reductase subunit